MTFNKRTRMLLLIIILPAAQALSGAAKEVHPVLEFITPQSGQTYEGAITFDIGLKNVTNQSYKVRISCFDMVHHFILQPYGNRSATQRVTMRIKDEYLPCSPGTHTLDVVIFPLNDPDTVLLKKEIPFTIKIPRGPDTDRLNKVLSANVRIELAENRYASLMSGFSPADPAVKRIQAWQADQLCETRVKFAIQGINQLAIMARYYRDALDPERALAILKTADRIFEEDFPLLAIHPVKGAIPYYDVEAFYDPYFFEIIADLYAQYGHLDKALAWCEKEEVFFREVAEKAKSMDDRRGAFYTLSRLYDRSALYHLLLADDEQAWENHRSQSRVFQQKAKALISSE